MPRAVKLYDFDLEQAICGRNFDVVGGWQDARMEGRLQMELVDEKPALTIYPDRNDLEGSGYHRRQFTSRVDAIESVHDDFSAETLISKALN